MVQGVHTQGSEVQKRVWGNNEKSEVNASERYQVDKWNGGLGIGGVWNRTQEAGHEVECGLKDSYTLHRNPVASTGGPFATLYNVIFIRGTDWAGE